LPRLPGDSGDLLRLAVSLWFGSEPRSVGLAGDSLSAIWPVQEGSLVGRKSGRPPAGRESARARRPATTPPPDSLRFTKTRDREFSPAPRSAVSQPEHFSLLRPVQGDGFAEGFDGDAG